LVYASAKDLKGYQECYETALMLYLDSTSQTRTKSNSPSRRYGASPKRSHRTVKSTMKSMFSTKSTKLTKSPLSTKVSQSVEDDAKAGHQTSVTVVADCREKYELQRYEHVKLVDDFLKSKMVELTETCVAAFTFVQSFFKQGFHECQSLENSVMDIRNYIGICRDVIQKKTNVIKMAEKELKKKLKNLAFETHDMDDVCEGIPGIRARVDDSEKGGYLNKKGQGIRKAWQRRWFYIKDGDLYYSRGKRGLEKNFVANLVISNIKEVQVDDRPYTFVLNNPQNSREYVLQAESKREVELWVKALRSVAENKLYAMNADDRNSESKNGEDNAQSFKLIKKLNSHCADCPSENPEWAVINLGICVCISCSGVHRSLGVQISQVRSIRLDSWAPSTLKLMCSMGSELFNSVYEESRQASLEKPSADAPEAVRRKYITSKYVDRKYVVTSGMKRSIADLNHKFVQACKNNATDEILKCFAQGANVNCEAQDGCSPIHVATAEGAEEALEFCVLNGGDVRKKDKDGRTPLAIAKDISNSRLQERLTELEDKLI